MMFWDEACAAVDLDKQFWAELFSSDTKFLWWPQYNALTGQRMWLCRAVCAGSGHIVQAGGGEYKFTTTRWYKPKDFVIESLKKG